MLFKKNVHLLTLQISLNWQYVSAAFIKLAFRVFRYLRLGTSFFV